MDPATPALPRPVTDAELAFLSRCLREPDLDVLRAHLARHVAEGIASSASYGCVKGMLYLEPRLPRWGAYHALRDAGAAERAAGGAPLWLDAGTGYGQDLRVLGADGWPTEDIAALDVARDLWDAGGRLFRDAATPPARVLFVENLCDPATVVGAPPDAPASAVASLRGAAAVVSALAVLHAVGDEGAVQALLNNAAALLRPGGALLGYCVGAKRGHAGPWMPPATLSVQTQRFLHDPDTLAAALSVAGLEGLSVVEADLDTVSGTRAAAVRAVDPTWATRSLLSFVGHKASGPHPFGGAGLSAGGLVLEY